MTPAQWPEPEAEYHGEFVHFEPIWCDPKPVQQPHPPIVLGSNTSQGVARVVRYCDGWLPNARIFPQLPTLLQELWRQAAQAGRRREEIAISILGAQGDEAVLRRCQELGAERAIFFVPSAGRETVLPLLDRYAALIPKVA
jgi:alkanesulfonate monooxygenase SsuD/methylene tetrahydromethanopterin reductase-like flavin-dependent oxidoreductase (luciferase family)